MKPETFLKLGVLAWLILIFALGPCAPEPGVVEPAIEGTIAPAPSPHEYTEGTENG